MFFLFFFTMHLFCSVVLCLFSVFGVRLWQAGLLVLIEITAFLDADTLILPKHVFYKNHPWHYWSWITMICFVLGHSDKNFYCMTVNIRSDLLFLRKAVAEIHSAHINVTQSTPFTNCSGKKMTSCVDKMHEGLCKKKELQCRCYTKGSRFNRKTKQIFAVW